MSVKRKANCSIRKAQHKGYGDETALVYHSIVYSLFSHRNVRSTGILTSARFVTRSSVVGQPIVVSVVAVANLSTLRFVFHDLSPPTSKHAFSVYQEMAGPNFDQHQPLPQLPQVVGGRGRISRTFLIILMSNDSGSRNRCSFRIILRFPYHGYDLHIHYIVFFHFKVLYCLF